MFNSTWEQERDKRYFFHTVCDSEMKNLNSIYPLNQQMVNDIYNAVHDDQRIDMIIVFGSSLNFRCNADSDVDLAVKLKPGFVTNADKDDISMKIQTACDWNADILWRDRISETEPILEEIRKGVILE